MQGWACGHCKHCATLFYQLREYIQLELKSVSDDKTCTDIVQTWHVPSESGNTTAIIFSELAFIKADQQKKENNSTKQPFATRERYFCATPLLDGEVKSEKIEELSKNLETYGLKTDFTATLRENNFEPCS